MCITPATAAATATATIGIIIHLVPASSSRWLSPPRPRRMPPRGTPLDWSCSTRDHLRHRGKVDEGMFESEGTNGGRGRVCVVYIYPPIIKHRNITMENL